MRCDCHVHIVGPAERYPQLPSRTYLAGEARLDTLQRIALPRGISRFVIVQPSFYGTDNTLLLEALDRLDGAGRGVAVIHPATAPATLENYARRGVRGLRVNLYSPLEGQTRDRLDRAFTTMAELAQRMQWHVEVIAPIALLRDAAQVLAQAPVPIVIDHYALHGTATPESADGRLLLQLLAQPHVWVKLSAPYRAVQQELATRPDPAWLRAILAAAGERCVWGSDWPHTPAHGRHAGAAITAPYRDLDYGALLGDFIGTLPPGWSERILQENPARLYGFA